MPNETVKHWLFERRANCERIAATKKDSLDRMGWLEDAEYFHKALRTIAVLSEALTVIRKGVADSPRPYEGFWPMRKFLDDRKIFNGDIDGDAVIVAVIDAAIREAEGR